ncbi:MAG: carboxy terminal-processing peptidase [Verrucomicrobia subdivision 3 bacterium]|nr:carboxy terminal-processing peptidase [Limisphaerales bacterium]
MRVIFVLLGLQLAVGAMAAESDTTLLSRKHVNGPLAPGPNDSNIARVVSMILEKGHYIREPFDDDISSKFLERYLDAWDNQHIYFVKSDLDSFEKYRTRLDDLTAKEGETGPARAIFTRFMERLRQQYDYVTNLLETEKFDFAGTNRFVYNRKTMPRPKDIEEARQLWRDRLRHEYLSEKLSIGRPEEIAGIVREKLRAKQGKEVAKALQDKMSKEKAQEIAKLVEERAGSEKPEAIARAVQSKLEKENAEEIKKLIVKRYTRVLRAYNDFDNDDVLQVYLTSLANVYDPHSDYMGKSELENFSIGMKLSLFGIGALLRSEDGFCKIQELKPGPAMRSKQLKPNDKIVGVAQDEEEFVDVVDMKLNKIVELIRGPKGSKVRLNVVPADASDPSARKVVSLVREEIKLEDQEAKAKIIELPAGKEKLLRLGVIDLPSFYSQFELEGQKAGAEPKSTTIDVARLIKKLADEHIAGIILDLRRNGGGSLEEAINLTGLFIKEGPVVQVKGPEGDPIIEKDRDSSVFYDGPLIVLTSRFSASASEILAGALQDYGRALIVGDSSTHGKGTVQSLLQLSPYMRQRGLAGTNNPGALKITIRKFYRASGSSTQLKGVVPDIVLPSVNNHLEVGEGSLDNPLPWDTIAAAEYTRLNRVEPFLAELRRRSDTRIAIDRDFSYIREDIERYKKRIAEKSVSLNEAQRLKEKQEDDERAKARKKEVAARPEPPGKMYEISLKQAEEPGLPPPVSKTNHTAKVDPTNSAHIAKAAASGADGAEEGEEKTPAMDVTLEETKRILVDLVYLSLQQNSLAGPTTKTRGQ